MGKRSNFERRDADGERAILAVGRCPGDPADALATALAARAFLEGNLLATPQTVLASEKFERFDAVFAGAGDTLSAALAALVAGGSDLAAAATEALAYLDRCLGGGFRPGMGHVVPDRLFWAQPEAEAADEDDASTGPSDFDLPAHDTKH